MAQLGLTFKAEELPGEEKNFEPLPAGWYTVQITGAEVKTTRSGTGQYIKPEFTVVGDNHQGRKVWGIINIVNDNQKAEEIGRSELKRLMSAVGIEVVSDTDELVGHTLQVKRKIRAATDDYEASNDVAGYKAAEKAKVSPEETTDSGEKKAPWAK